jgi:hypothetical protein
MEEQPMAGRRVDLRFAELLPATLVKPASLARPPAPDPPKLLGSRSDITGRRLLSWVASRLSDLEEWGFAPKDKHQDSGSLAKQFIERMRDSYALSELLDSEKLDHDHKRDVELAIAEAFTFSTTAYARSRRDLSAMIAEIKRIILVLDEASYLVIGARAAHASLSNRVPDDVPLSLDWLVYYYRVLLVTAESQLPQPGRGRPINTVGMLVRGLTLPLSALDPEHRHNMVVEIASDILSVRIKARKVAALERQHRHRAKAADTASTKA